MKGLTSSGTPACFLRDMFFVKVFLLRQKTCSLLRWERDGEELLLNYTGDQFAAAGFTFLLFDVFDPKVN